MFEDEDLALDVVFDWRTGFTVTGPGLPPSTEELVQDLELLTLLRAMAHGDSLLFEISKRALISSLTDTRAITYRQEVLADCLSHPEMFREMYTLAMEAAFLAKSVLFEFITFAGAGRRLHRDRIYIVVSLFAAYLGARVGAKQRVGIGRSRGSRSRPAARPKVLDTSVIIDGRILDIVRSGFLDGPLLLPRFVLARTAEHRRFERSDASHARPARARRVDQTAGAHAAGDHRARLRRRRGEVDAKLVLLARERGAKLVTNDYNLNRVANVEGVAVLNINELANAVKPVLLPGEELRVALIKEGKEPHQGVGYLDDGTMIVVENGRRQIGETVDVAVTSALQTAAGRMIFARLKR